VTAEKQKAGRRTKRQLLINFSIERGSRKAFQWARKRRTGFSDDMASLFLWQKREESHHKKVELDSSY
jgi:hypothetical protein